MQISFIEILLKPFKADKLFVHLFLLFLPAMLAAYCLGTDNWVFNVMHVIGLTILYGYLCEFMQNEVEDSEEDDIPKWMFLQNFFTGIKGGLFFLVNAALLTTMILALWLFIGFIPGFEPYVKGIAVFLIAYWVFIYYAVALGMFVQEFNPIVALNFSTILQIANSCLFNYFMAFIYVIICTIIIGLLGWMVISIFGINLVIIEIFAIYGVVIYSLLYTEVFKQVREEFENYI